MFIESYPDDLTLLSFFDSEPILADNLDRHFTYEFTDKNKIHLVFLLNALAGWIQTILTFNGNKIAGYLSEGLSKFTIKEYVHNEYLYA
nr:hypothetical protein [Providencia stuartii]ELR5080974.1 hypothetical protein [Providencia stuartii]